MSIGMDVEQRGRKLLTVNFRTGVTLFVGTFEGLMGNFAHSFSSSVFVFFYWSIYDSALGFGNATVRAPEC